MADDDDSEEEEGPPIELGDGEPVEGAPLARIGFRLTWGSSKSDVIVREGETEIRTPDGPQKLEDVLATVEKPYFESRQEFIDAVEDVIGSGPIPTADRET